MNKLLYITNGINGAGGLERVLSIKASYFAEQDKDEVHILVLNNANQNNFYEFSCRIHHHSINVGGSPFQYLKNYKKGIQDLVENINPDIISVCDDGLKAFFIPLFLKTNAKIIYERHVSKLIEMRNDFGVFKKLSIETKWWLMERLGKNFAKFVVLTPGNKNEWKSLSNMEVVANPLSFYPEASSTLENKIVICVGKISYQKGQDLLAKAWEKVHMRFPDWQLHLYGKENLGILNTNHLDNNIHFFHPDKNIEEKYLESSIYVMSSRFEGFGMVLTEAMACGIPCVSFDCDYGPADIITHNEDGYLADKNNINELADRLLDLIGNEQRRKEFGKKAKLNVSKYQIENIAKEWKSMFDSLLK